MNFEESYPSISSFIVQSLNDTFYIPNLRIAIISEMNSYSLTVKNFIL
jgi:hypothetical protein